MNRFSRRPLGYVIAVILGVAGIGGLSTALAQEHAHGDAYPAPSRGQGEQQGQDRNGLTDCQQGEKVNEHGKACAPGQSRRPARVVVHVHPRVVQAAPPARRVGVVRAARFTG
jgi:hypothetical protein